MTNMRRRRLLANYEKEFYIYPLRNVHDPERRGFAFTIFAVLAFLCVAVLYFMFSFHTMEWYPVPVNGPLTNPMVGFAPPANDYENVGDNTLVFVSVTWREWEPQRGVYDYESLEEDNHLAQWRAMGKRVVFRFICDLPGEEEHLDIPDWLYDEIEGDGDWYDTSYGKGFSPNYANEILIQRHRKAIQALGERYGADDFFCYIELGSLGHWGEWHTKYEDNIRRMPDAGVREQYILPYVESFPHAMLLMRRPFKEAKRYGTGIYNDATGVEEDTREWLNWIRYGGTYEETGEEDALVPMANAWKRAPIGGEFTDSIPMSHMLDQRIETTLQLIRESHMTFLGPLCPDSTEFGEGLHHGADLVRNALGYRLRIDKVTLTESFLIPKGLQIGLDWINEGTAPMYRDWDVYLYLLDRKGQEVLKEKVEIDLRDIVGESKVKSVTELPVGNLPKGVYELGIAIIDPLTGQPAVAFAMENTRTDRIYVLGRWEKK